MHVKYFLASLKGYRPYMLDLKVKCDTALPSGTGQTARCGKSLSSLYRPVAAIPIPWQCFTGLGLVHLGGSPAHVRIFRRRRNRSMDTPSR